MSITNRGLFFLLCFLAQMTLLRAALGEPASVLFKSAQGAFPIVHEGKSPLLLVDKQDWPGVLRVARDFQADIEWVTGVKPNIDNAIPSDCTAVVIIGTIGRSSLIDGLVREGKLDVGVVQGQWESWVMQVVASPFPGVEHALVIAGSDKRGTIYGVYDLSQQMGVSPWYWWADVPATPHKTLFVKPERVVHGPPAVKYRGVFINDEAPCLTNWVRAKYGTASARANPPVPEGIANYGHKFYGRIFEALLRARGNYLWPAMWNNAFNEDDPENARLADEYGIVMGTSHQEPMLRAQKEWDRRFQKEIGSWNYAKQPRLMEEFWREGIRRNKDFESIVTLGLRGANDTEMAPGGPAANRVLLEKIVREQREILQKEMGVDAAKIPQVWCLYKEVQDYYEDGMRVPDDVTLLWADDNWGNIRRLPTPAERKRAGGAGVYYHFDYVGGPRSYKWLDTNPLPKIWEQMSLATQYGADRIWIVNVGDFKGMERPMEFFLNLAWQPSRWNHENVQEFSRLWAEREFGSEFAVEIADIVDRTVKYHGRRKPEMLKPDTFSLTHYREAETVVADFKAVLDRAEAIFAKMPRERRDAFYQLVVFPAKAGTVVNALYLAAAKNALYAHQGRASAAAFAAQARALFQTDQELMEFYNTRFAGGRWSHFMDQAHLGYTSWKDPGKDSLDHIKLIEPVALEAGGLGVAIEGSTAAWPGAVEKPGLIPGPVLPRFDVFKQQTRFIDVFNRGKTPFDFTAEPSAPWIVLSEVRGSTDKDRRVRVSIDWASVPTGLTGGTVKITGAGAEVVVKIEAFNPPEITRDALQGFVEGEGVVAIEPEHFTRKVDAGESCWVRIDDYGRTLSGMRAEARVDTSPVNPGKNSPCLEYQMYLFSTGQVEVNVITGPILDFIPDRPVRVAVSFDDEKPQVLTLVPKDYHVGHSNRAWEKSVGDQAHVVHSNHVVSKPGYHTLKIWMVDANVVIQKLVVNTGGLQPSYLGPPESVRGK